MNAERSGTGTERPVLNLQPMRAGDLAEILPIEEELFGVERWTPGMFRTELDAGHYYLVARDDDGVLLGYGGLAIYPPEGWVNNLAVRRDAQRRGVGAALLEALLAEAKRREVRMVLLEVAATNEPAQQLYRRYGFEVVAVRRGYYQPSNTDALVMKREL
jgi:ribosomal-protein-alanine N-acetyltransferase